MRSLQRVCIFCGSSRDVAQPYVDAAAAVATALASAGIGIVYGGGDRGLMGVVASTALACGATVTGVMPRGLFTGIGSPAGGLTSLVEVDSMHIRKETMYAMSDGFVGLPGGLGTLEEVAEIATWAQLGLHAKPIVLLDLDGFWSPLLAWLDGAVARGFVTPGNRAIIASVTSAGEVLPGLRTYGR